MNTKHILFLSGLLWLLPFCLKAQFNCPEPTIITGNLLVCPGEFTILKTAAVPNATYQWFERKFGTNLSVPIPGANADSVMVISEQTPIFVRVEVTQPSCLGVSEEVLVDGIVFLPLTVESAGDFDISPEGELLICPGETVLLRTLLPYTINNVWYVDGEAIPGANQQLYTVTMPGDYTASASPEPCPNWTEFLGATIPVRWKPANQCVNSSPDTPADIAAIHVFPNPVSDWLTIESKHTGIVNVRITDVTGRTVMATEVTGQQKIDVGRLSAGVYHILVNDQSGKVLSQQKLLKM
jgi:Secretion system C-terminal sorting domain